MDICIYLNVYIRKTQIINYDHIIYAKYFVVVPG